MTFGVKENSGRDARDCDLWVGENWKVRPGTSLMRQQPSVLVLNDFKCHRDKFLATLPKDANTGTVLIPGSLTPFVQPLDHVLDKEMKRRLTAKYTAWAASSESVGSPG